MAEEETTEAELPLENSGMRLLRAREAAGLSRADIAARTKIAERHLESIETSNFGALASSTYAVGFARSYARAVGLDERQIALDLREELDSSGIGEKRRTVQTFEPGDPARVPGSGMAWLAGLGGLLFLAASYFIWRSLYAPAVELPDLAAPPEASVTAPVQPGAASGAAVAVAVAAQTGGEVVFTAMEQGIWVKFYDASGAQLMQKQMALGETYAVPATANGPQIWTGRPEMLRITIGGKAVPPLADKQTTLKNVPVSAAALLARPATPPVAAVPAAAVLPAAPAPAVR